VRDCLWLEGEDIGEGSLSCRASRRLIIVIVIVDLSYRLFIRFIIELDRLMNGPFRELNMVMLAESGLNLMLLFLFLRKCLMPMLRPGPRREVFGPPRRVHQAIKLVGLPISTIVTLVYVGQRHVLSGVILLLVLVVMQGHIVVVRLQRRLAALVDLLLLLLDFSLHATDILFLMLLSVLAVHKEGDTADEHSHSK
jgi:hypothetical protein